MKNIIVETKNVTKARAMLHKMARVKGARMVLCFGASGTGKSHFARKIFAKYLWGYYRLETMETPRSFLQEVYRTLNFRVNGNEDVIKGNSATLAKEVIKLFQTAKKYNNDDSFILFVDEINLAIQHCKWQILELLRDFRDKGDAKIFMIGENDTKEKLRIYNAHFFNRFSGFCEFSTPSSKEIMQILVSTIEIGLDKKTAAEIVKEARGSLHHLESIVKGLEFVAEENNLESLSWEAAEKIIQDIKAENDFSTKKNS